MANIGLPTGRAFDILDVDGPAALDALECAGPIGDPDIEGPTVSTPRGWHVFVEVTGRGNAVNLGDLIGVDWRGAGGYVVAPPSWKADGTRWEWIIVPPHDLGPDTAIVPAPDWVLALFDRRAEMPAGGPARHAGRTAYGAAALERELGRLVMAAEGTRNHTLNRAAFSLGQLVAGGDLSVDEVGDALLNTALRIGLGETESVGTIKSGLRKGLTTPRSSKVS
jgi:Bifunctional DNA primase/polymerase, N-terminal